MCDVLAVPDGTSYLERVAVNTPAAVSRTKKAIANAKEMRMRMLTARAEKIDVNARNADKRSMGQMTTKNLSRISMSEAFMARRGYMNRLGMRVKMLLV